MKVMKRAELAALLRSVAASVEAGDSFEGSLQYSEIQNENLGPSEVEVQAAVRVGNLQGQGGMTLL